LKKNLPLKKLEILLDPPTAKAVRRAGGESNKNKSEAGAGGGQPPPRIQ